MAEQYHCDVCGAVLWALAGEKPREVEASHLLENHESEVSEDVVEEAREVLA